MLIAIMLAALAQAAARPCGLAEARDRAAVLAAEARWVKALEIRDGVRLACLLGAEFADTNWAGQRVARDQVLAVLPHRADMRLELSGMTVLLHGDVAIVHGLNRQRNAAGKIAGAVRFTDIFFYRAGRWQAVSAQETLVRDAQPGP